MIKQNLYDIITDALSARNIVIDDRHGLLKEYFDKFTPDSDGWNALIEHVVPVLNGTHALSHLMDSDYIEKTFNAFAEGKNQINLHDLLLIMLEDSSVEAGRQVETLLQEVVGSHQPELFSL